MGGDPAAIFCNLSVGERDYFSVERFDMIVIIPEVILDIVVPYISGRRANPGSGGWVTNEWMDGYSPSAWLHHGAQHYLLLCKNKLSINGCRPVGSRPCRGGGEMVVFG